tara:strand:+ start:285 stop:494 length:210 start_codon:yes stop_codon:yes gene_type:complete
MTLNKGQLWLVEVFQAYRKKHHLPNQSADDLLNPPFSDKLTGQQIDWLQQFIVVWETVEYNVNTNSGDT